MPQGFYDGIRNAVTDLACTGAAGGGWVARKLAGIGISTEGIQQRLDKFQVGHCGADPDNLTPQSSPPKFTGGQCPKPYNGTMVTTVIQDGNPNGVFVQDFPISFLNITGPIQDVRINPSNKNQVQVITPAGATTVNTLTIGGQDHFNLRDIVITASDGVDDCGNLPGGDIPPEGETTDTIDVDFELPDGTAINLPNLPIKTFPPCVDLNEVSIPFELDTPFGPVCGRIGIEFTLLGQVAPTIDFTQCPGDREDAGIPRVDPSEFFELGEWVGSSVTVEPSWAGTLAPSVDLEEPPILGIIYEAERDDSVSTTTTIPGKIPTAPAVHVPYIGLAHFELIIPTEFESATGQFVESYESGFSNDRPLKKNAGIIPCEWPFGAASVQVSFEFGWTGRYRVVRRKSCCDKCAEDNAGQELDNWSRCA